MNLPIYSPTPGRPHAVLVVDDDDVVRDALCSQLACDGWDVIGCSHAAEALSLLERQEFAVILSDQNMPGMKGLEFLGVARGIQPATSRLLITGILSTHTLIEAINQGEIYRFLSKPWTRAELLVCVRNAVGRYEMALANAGLRFENESLRSQLAASQAALEATRHALPSVASDAGLLHRASEAHSAAVIHRLPDAGGVPASEEHLVFYC